MARTVASFNPARVARGFNESARAEISGLHGSINVVGFIASDDQPSLEYAQAAQAKFAEVGIHYDLRYIQRLDLEAQILKANNDADIHGIFIYFPVFHNEQDSYLRNLVDYRKDIEAGSIYWTQKLYSNDRLAINGDQTKKALLPCTPLAIVKLFTELGIYAGDVDRPLAGKTISIFNRSEVIGRPLAVMMSNDGARVYSFDVNGPLLFLDATAEEIDITRAEALAASDIIITGVPSSSFEKIHTAEFSSDTVCLNFSSYPNFDADVADYCSVYVPRIGPMTVAMCIRNTLRLYQNFHQHVQTKRTSHD
jgi:methylenetetrahydrofolate dehydrogenase (NADP+)/methenyltetrahydrofolate cyclohydrolase